MNKLKFTAIAQVAYDASSAFCLAFDTEVQTVTIWQNAPAWHKETFILGVRELANKPDMTEQELHQFWCKLLLKAGYRYGSVKSAEAKTHPGMAEWNELPAKQQAKYRLFKVIVLALLEVEL